MRYIYYGDGFGENISLQKIQTNHLEEDYFCCKMYLG